MHRRTLVVLAAAAILGACDSGTEPRVPASVQVNQPSLSLAVGQSATVEAVILDQHGRAYDVPPPDFAITWTSTNPAVASVVGGVITGNQGGQATIRAQAGSLPPADVQVSVVSTLFLTDGTLDIPVLDGDEPDATVVSTRMGFTYSGHRSGTFLVDTTVALGVVDESVSFAYTFYNEQFDDQDLVAWQRRADGRLDYMEIYVDSPVSGTGTFEVYLGFLFLGWNPNTEDYENFYILEDAPLGTLTVTSAAGGRLVGTFQLSMEVAMDAVTSLMAPAEQEPRSRPLRPSLR
jgi:hypothetical protein